MQRSLKLRHGNELHWQKSHELVQDQNNMDTQGGTTSLLNEEQVGKSMVQVCKTEKMLETILTIYTYQVYDFYKN